MTEWIEDLYHAFLEVGENPLLFWDLSIPEVQDVIIAYKKRKVEDIKWQATLTKVLADQIGERIGMIIHGSENTEIAPIWEFFPSLFEKEKKEAEKRSREMQLSKYKSDWLAYAKRHNERRAGY